MKDIGYIKREITFFSGHGRQISANSILKNPISMWVLSQLFYKTSTSGSCWCCIILLFQIRVWEMIMTWRIPKVLSFGHTLRIVLFTNFQIPSSNFHSPSSATITYPTHPRKTLQLQSSHGVPRIGYNTDKEVQIWDSTTDWSSWRSLKSWSLLIGQVKLGNSCLIQKDLFCTVQIWAIVPQGCANTRAKGVFFKVCNVCTKTYQDSFHKTLKKVGKWAIPDEYGQKKQCQVAEDPKVECLSFQWHTKFAVTQCGIVQ